MPTGQRAVVDRRRESVGRRGTCYGYPESPSASHGAACPPAGYPPAVITSLIHNLRFRSWQMHAASMGSIGLCIGLWIRAKTVDQDERGNAERRALFVGLWPPTFWLIGDSLKDYE